VTALASEIGCGLAEVVADACVGAVGDEQLDQVAAVGCGCGEDGGKAGGLAGVGIGAGGQEQLDCLRIAAEGECGVERRTASGEPKAAAR